MVYRMFYAFLFALMIFVDSRLKSSSSSSCSIWDSGRISFVSYTRFTSGAQRSQQQQQQTGSHARTRERSSPTLTQTQQYALICVCRVLMCPLCPKSRNTKPAPPSEQITVFTFCARANRRVRRIESDIRRRIIWQHRIVM